MDGALLFFLQALKKSAVFAVDGNDGSLVLLSKLHQALSGRNEHLLICKKKDLFAAQGEGGRQDSDTSGHGRDDMGSLFKSSHFVQPVASCHHPDSRGKAFGKLKGLFPVIDGNQFRQKLTGLGLEKIDAALGS